MQTKNFLIVTQSFGSRNSHRPLVVMFRTPSGCETVIGPKGRDVERPFGAFNNHRPLVVMFRTPKGCETIFDPKGRDDWHRVPSRRSAPMFRAPSGCETIIDPKGRDVAKQQSSTRKITRVTGVILLFYQ
jgi:hypothetical protein